jgi:hypothetical protein
MNDTWLAHHGILGQKWGIRRFQNKDGSYTAAGKKRYSYADVDKDFDESISSHRDAYERIKQGNKSIPEMADDLMKDYEKAFDNVKLDQSAKDRILKKLNDDFGVGCDDRDYFEMYRDDYIRDEVMNKVNNAVKDKRAAFEARQDEYWKDVDSIVSQIKDKYGDKRVDGSYMNDGKMAVNDIMGKKLDTRYNSYISRHFDDYWVDDTDACYNAIDRVSKELNLTMEDYNKKYAKS